MAVYDEYAKALAEEGALLKGIQEKSTKAQLEQLAENKKLVEAEKQNAMRGAYVDYAKNINPYGVQSELAYGAGLGGAGKGETAMANYYNTYQNRLGDINTNVTGQLRDIANQEATARLAGDQAKLQIDADINSRLAAAQREDAIRQEGYAREDKANAYNQLLTAISSTGYNPTDAELTAAGMTRDMANAYKAAYARSLYSNNTPAKQNYLSEDKYIDIVDTVKNAEYAEDAEAYLNVVLGNGYANFGEKDAVDLLAKYWPYTNVKKVGDKRAVLNKNGQWVTLEDNWA